MDILQTANERMEQLAALMNKDIEQKKFQLGKK